jgi:hypothetical protein
MLQAPEDGAAAGSEDSDQAAEPALRLLHAHPAVASRQESAAALAAPAEHHQQQQPTQAAVADGGGTVIKSSTVEAHGAAAGESAVGLSAIAALDTNVAAQADEATPRPEAAVPISTAARDADPAAATATPASTAAVQPMVVMPEATAAASDIQMNGTTAAASETTPAAPSSPRG